MGKEWFIVNERGIVEFNERLQSVVEGRMNEMQGRRKEWEEWEKRVKFVITHQIESEMATANDELMR